MRPQRARGRRRYGRITGGSDQSVDSRWWYWIAAVPATFALWAIAVVWVAVAIAVGPLSGSHPIVRSAEISMVAFGVPFFVLIVVFPFAVYADVGAILATEVEWRPRQWTLTAAAAAGPLLAIGALAFGVLTDGGVSVPLRAVGLGFLLTVPVAAYYLHRRHDRLGVP